MMLDDGMGVTGSLTKSYGIRLDLMKYGILRHHFSS